MIYVDFLGNRVSSLGLGVMRLPTIGGDDSRIDEEAAHRMIERALELGINYLDTGWDYHRGASEPFLGRCLAERPRNSFFVADKFPGYDTKWFGRHEELFEGQLERLGVDRIDYYLLHDVNESDIEPYLDDDRYHTVSYLAAQRDAGRIGHLGFSAHARPDTMERLLDRYGSELEFCQIQLNWLDWGFQDANAKVRLCEERGIPIVVMEPLRGGALATLDEAYMDRLSAAHPGMSASEWGLRWLQGIGQVAVTLSGMSTLGEIEQNAAVYEERRPLSASELSALEGIADDMAASIGVPCTGCRYCVSHCPKELDIPYLLSLYNQTQSRKDDFVGARGARALPEGKRPADCVACRSCEEVCPQGIEVSGVMARFAADLEG